MERMEENSHAQGTVVEKPDGKRPLKDLDVGGKNTLKSILKYQDKRIYVGLMWLMTFGGSIKCGDIPHQPKTCVGNSTDLVTSGHCCQVRLGYVARGWLHSTAANSDLFSGRRVNTISWCDTIPGIRFLHYTNTFWHAVYGVSHESQFFYPVCPFIMLQFVLPIFDARMTILTTQI